MTRSVFLAGILGSLLTAGCAKPSAPPETGSPCDGVDCSGNGSCSVVEGAASCTCNPGFRAGAGPSCVDIDECAERTDTCQVHADCVNTSPGYRCSAFAVLALDDGSHGLEPYLLRDGVATLLADINPGGSSNPIGFAWLGEKVVFTAYDAAHGTELWITDGTPAGTKLLKDIEPGAASSNPSYLTSVGDRVFFDAFGDQQLWVTDGTEAGTVLVQATAPGGGHLYAYGLARCGARICFFSAGDTVHGTEPWASDGTAAGTQLLLDIAPSGGSIGCNGCFTSLGEKMVFPAEDAQGLQLWITDGTPAGTKLLKVINPSGNSYPNTLTLIGDRIYFSADDGRSGSEPWVTDGTEAGTVRLADLNPGAQGSTPQAFARLGDKIYALASDASGSALFALDGAGQATKLKAVGLPNKRRGQVWLTPHRGKLFFSGVDDASTGIELYVSDGTEKGTTLAKDIAPGTADSKPLPLELAASWGTAALAETFDGFYFGATDPTDGYELWLSDGTAVGTRRWADFNPGPGDGLALLP